MGLFNWLFGNKETHVTPQPTVTVGMDSDAWLDWMLDELDEKDRRKAQMSENQIRRERRERNH